MVTLYEFIRAAHDAEPAVIAKLIQDTRLRLQQSGRLNENNNADRLREAKDILLNPTKRAEYDKKLELTNLLREGATQFHGKRVQKKRTSTLSVVMLIVIVAGFIAGVILYSTWDNLVHWPNGVYLVSNATGEVSAVLVAYEGRHKFSKGRVMAAYEIKVLNSGKFRWLGVKQLRAEFSKGSPAPQKLWKKPAGE